MTEAGFFGFIRSGLRAKWVRWWPRYEALKDARRKYEGPDKRRKWEFICAVCNKWWQQREVQVDHIEPCGSLRSFDDLAGFVQRLFVEKDKLRIVCIKCHHTLTEDSRCSRALDVSP